MAAPLPLLLPLLPPLLLLLLLLLTGPTPSVDADVVDRTGCNRTVDAGDLLTHPQLTAANKGRPYNCWFLVKPRVTSLAKDTIAFVIVLKFQRFQWGQLINATTCAGGHLRIYDGSTALHDSGNPGFFCGEVERSRLFISESSPVKLHFTADAYDDQFQFAVYTRQEEQQQLVERYGHHPSLYPHRRGQPITPGSLSCDREFVDCRLQTCFVQSPNFPGVYPRNRRCLYHVSTRQPYIKLFTEDGEFNVDGQRCDNYIMCPLRPISEETCPHDYIRVYDGNSESSVIIGTFCGIGRFPFSIVGTSNELLLEFVSSPAGPLLNTGFHFNIDSWPGNVGNVFGQQMQQDPNEKQLGNRTKANPTCSFVLTSSGLEGSGDPEGFFLSPMHWYPPDTICTYLITGQAGQIVRLYFPTFRIGRPDAPIVAPAGDCSESLTIYDGPDVNPATVIKSFCDTFSRPPERKDFVSTGNAIFIRFTSSIGSYSGSSLNFWAQYDFFNNSRQEGRPRPGTECDAVYDAAGRADGRWTSPYNTLLYKRPSDGHHLKCRYFFQGNRRNSSRVLLTLEALNLKSTLYPCADNLMLRDAKNDLTVLDVDAVHLADTGNFTASKAKAYLCQHQTDTDNWKGPVRVLSSSTSLMAALQVNAVRSTTLYFKSNVPLFQGRYDFIHPTYICGSPQPNLADNGVINLPPYLEEEDQMGPVICAWDFALNRPASSASASSSSSSSSYPSYSAATPTPRRDAANQTAAFLLHIEVSSTLNFTQVSKRSQCRPDSNYLEVSVPGNSTSRLLLCPVQQQLQQQLQQQQRQYQATPRRDATGAAFTTVVPLVASSLPQNKVVLLVRLDTVNVNYSIRVTWTGVAR